MHYPPSGTRMMHQVSPVELSASMHYEPSLPRHSYDASSLFELRGIDALPTHLRGNNLMHHRRQPFSYPVNFQCIIWRGIDALLAEPPPLFVTSGSLRWGFWISLRRVLHINT